MTEVLLSLGVLMALTLPLVWWCLSARAGEESPAAANALIFRQRLGELEQDRERGGLDDETFQQLKTELERQLLAENQAVDSRPEGRGLPSLLVIGLAAVVMLAGGLLYRSLGAWPEMRVNELQQSLSGKRRFSPDDMAQLAAAIDTSLAYRPDNPELRYWSAQLAVEQGDYGKAVDSYRRLLESSPESPAVMAQLAQAIFLEEGRTLTTEARQLMERAIALDPQQTTALGMLGMDAFERGEYREAVERWSVLLRNLSPQSPQSQVIGGALQRAKLLAFEAGSLDGIPVTVRAGDDLPAQGVLFVFAKAAEGPGFPLAVIRSPQQGGEWPQRYLLTPLDAMRAEMTLDQYDEVRLTARFSRNGSVAPASGDIEGQSAVLQWRELSEPVELLLDTRIP